jgi:hypothetical protein
LERRINAEGQSLVTGTKVNQHREPRTPYVRKQDCRKFRVTGIFSQLLYEGRYFPFTIDLLIDYFDVVGARLLELLQVSSQVLGHKVLLRNGFSTPLGDTSPA